MKKVIHTTVYFMCLSLFRVSFLFLINQRKISSNSNVHFHVRTYMYDRLLHGTINSSSCFFLLLYFRRRRRSVLNQMMMYIGIYHK